MMSSNGGGAGPPDTQIVIPDIWEPGLGLRRRADGRVFVLAVAAAILTDAAVRSGVATAAGSSLVVLVTGAMFVSGRLHRPQARGLVAVAPLFGFWLVVHTRCG